ncbi:ribonuclease-like 3 [Anarrhichthys ocellatus]|uniref:ribonuclease-like 3 n=1 Tax=Anarrhichthys ocellatus TaxID=433405 RepID=UPI0012EEA527|nr:angiogenin [Anarrhichthys ocellatus]
MRIPFACMLLLSATVLAQVPNDRYREFINQHMNNHMSADRCDQVIDSRRITKTNTNECKETNTFILSTTSHVVDICVHAGQPFGQMTKSSSPFFIIVCELKNHGARRPHCQYRGQRRTRYIAIKCENGFPVHYDGDIVHFEN